jgi:hypothetical protein
MIDEVIITAIFTGIVSVLALTFKNIKSSHCWNKDECCVCDTRGNRNSNSNIIIQQPPIQQPLIQQQPIQQQPIQQHIPQPTNESNL